jgi:hypothetical protein
VCFTNKNVLNNGSSPSGDLNLKMGDLTLKNNGFPWGI